MLFLASLIILITNAAKDIASIKASNTVISLTPLQGDSAAHPPDSVVHPDYITIFQQLGQASKRFLSEACFSLVYP
ncbi:hypothetical protein JCM15765_25620 [Paradesulfitobacterium aromaticivorans]